MMLGLVGDCAVANVFLVGEEDVSEEMGCPCPSSQRDERGEELPSWRFFCVSSMIDHPVLLCLGQSACLCDQLATCPVPPTRSSRQAVSRTGAVGNQKATQLLLCRAM